MTKKFHILLIILTLGFFVTPTLTYACGTKTDKTEKSCCKKSEKGNKKDCCKNHKSKNYKDNKGCDGKCNNSNCSCPTSHCAFALPSWIETKIKTYFSESKKTKNYYNETYLSDGYYSIWTPPNIGQFLALTAIGLSNPKQIICFLILNYLQNFKISKFQNFKK